MARFKVLQARESGFLVLGEFHNKADAIDLADRAKFMRPIVYIDDGRCPLDALTLEEALGHSIKVVGSPRSPHPTP